MEKIRFMFLRDRCGGSNKRGQPLGCVAISLSSDRKTIWYQYSVVNPIDGFNRALARELAAGRLVTKPITIFSHYPMAGIHSISRAVMNDIATSKNIPSRARNSALRWLKDLKKSL